MTTPNEPIPSDLSALEELEAESPGVILPLLDDDGVLHEYHSVFDD
jgi:hypothetical protein